MKKYTAALAGVGYVYPRVNVFVGEDEVANTGSARRQKSIPFKSIIVPINLACGKKHTSSPAFGKREG